MSRDALATLDGVSFRKSSRSDPNMNCVEIGHAADVFGVRDSKATLSSVLAVDVEQGRAFLGAIKAGRFDR